MTIFAGYLRAHTKLQACRATPFSRKVGEWGSTLYLQHQVKKTSAQILNYFHKFIIICLHFPVMQTRDYKILLLNVNKMKMLEKFNFDFNHVSFV
jgi:hypothetical protein